MLRSILTGTLAYVILAATGCNLSDPIGGPPTTQGPDDGGMVVSDAGNDPDTGAPDSSTPVPDAAMPDLGPDPDGGGEPDMGTPVSAETFFAEYATAICESLLRIDYAPSDMYFIQTVDDCVATLDAYFAPEFEFIAHDARQGRLTLEPDFADEVLRQARTLSHPSQLDGIYFYDAYVPLSDAEGPCATYASCVQPRDANLSCIKASDSGCDGICAPYARLCDGVICDVSEYCATDVTPTCSPLKVDGTPCGIDRECENFCVYSPNGTAACGALALDEDCSSSQNSCDNGLFCDLATLTCQPIASDGQRCARDEGCGVDSVCQGGFCVALGAGTRCRHDYLCPEDLSCVQVSAAAPDRACFARRNTGEPCNSDRMCPGTDFCNYDVSPAVCEAKRGLGQSCRYGDQCDGMLACRTISISVPGTCEEWRWGLAEGEVCFDEAAACSFGLACVKDAPDSNRGTCEQRARPQPGEPCTQFAECDGGYCENEVCVARHALGESCDYSAQCATGTCDDSTGTCVDSICP